MRSLEELDSGELRAVVVRSRDDVALPPIDPGKRPWLARAGHGARQISAHEEEVTLLLTPFGIPVVDLD